MPLQDSIAAMPETLIPGLRFSDVGSTANYIIGSDMQSVFPASGNVFSLAGIRVLRFNLASNHYIVPDSIRLQAMFKNTSSPEAAPDQAKPRICPLPNSCGLMSVVSRARLLCGGVLIEDVQECSRVMAMMPPLAAA